MRIRFALASAIAITCFSVAADAQQANWPKNLTLGTASVGGTFFIYGQGWAQLVNEKLGTNISTQQTQGPNQNVILTDSKQIELGMTTMGVALQAWEGSAEWTKGQKFRNIRAMFPMYDTPFHFITLENKPIRSVKDLNGKIVGVGPRAGTPGTYFPMFFEVLGLKVTVRNGQASDMAAQLADGLLDAFPFAAGTPIAAYSELEAQTKVRFFTFTDDEIKTLRQKFPELSPSTISAGTYKSQTTDHKTIGLFNFSIANKDMPDDLVYAIVKVVLENHDAMKKIHAASVETVLSNWDKNEFLPFHPGAIRYYKEKGIQIPQKLIPPEYKG
jgi:uncharacterized protein